MAARRLKFKPKPSVANSGRRIRDKEDFLGSTQNEPSVTDIEPSVTSKEVLDCEIENLDSSSRTEDGYDDLKLTKTTQIDDHPDSIEGSEEAAITHDTLAIESCNVQGSQNSCSIADNWPTSPKLGEPSDQDKDPSNSLLSIKSSCAKDENSILHIPQNREICSEPSEQDEDPSNSSLSIKSSFAKDENSILHIPQNREICEALSSQRTETKPTISTSDITSENVSIDSNTDPSSLSCTRDSDNGAIVSNDSTKDPKCDQSTIKSDSAKIFSRFGRSRCKPVLNNSSLRKKNEVTESIDSSSSVDNLRTDSVIKSVKSELNKVNSSKENDEDCNLSEANKREKTSINPNHRSSLESNIGSDEITTVEKNQSVILPVVEGFLLTIATVNKDLNKKNDNETSMKGPDCIDLSSKIDIMSSPNKNNTEFSNPVTKPTTPTIKVSVSPLRPNSKVLVPKPSPRLTDAASRRISFQGSDSEDEAKRKNLRLKIKSNIKKINKKDKVLKNSKRKRSQGPTFSKLGQDTMKELAKKFIDIEGTPDKTKLTMLDLIFYNPKNNPMTMNPNQAPAVQKKEGKVEVSQAVEELLEEQSVDDVDSTAGAMPVPQLKVGPDGQIMLDPQSLVIETTGMQKSREKLENSQVVRENGITRYNPYRFRKHNRSDWTPKETLQFYRALSTIGSDFSLMTKLFPKRSRHELKLKFKREERTNMPLVDKAMTMRAGFDFQALEKELKQENEEIERKQKEKEHAKEAARRHRDLKRARKTDIVTKNVLDKTLKIRDSAFNEFSNDEVSTLYEEKPKRQPRKRNVKKAKKKFDSDTEDDLVLEHDSSDNNIKSFNSSLKNSTTFPHSNRKRSKRLNECEEINETLKKKLEREKATEMNDQSEALDDELVSEDDGYTPNGLNAFMLFGSPERGPAKEIETKSSQIEDNPVWDIEIKKTPTIEETVMPDNVEEVSELSGLGSFGQNDTALDLSIPVRANITSDMLKSRHSLFDSHLISESIQIIDQLTSTESSCNSVFIVRKENTERGDDALVEKELDDSQFRLPSFESVNRSRPSIVYPLQVPYDPSNYQRNAPAVVDAEDNQNVQENSDLPNVFVANFYRETETEECILGD